MKFLFFSKKPSLSQIRWLPVMFFCAVMLFGLRLHEKQHAFFQKNPLDFLSKLSFFNVSPLKAADPSPASRPPESAAEAPKSSFPDSKVESSIPPSPSPSASSAPSPAPPKNPVPPQQALDILSLTTEEVKVLQSLATRRSDIERREKEINEKEKVVRVIEKRIQDKISELQNIQDTLKELLVAREKQESAELKGLIKIYELMKPEKAAEILSGLGADVLLDLLNGMKDNKLAPILAQMNPVIAQQITMALAERRKLTQEIQQIAQQPQQPQP